MPHASHVVEIARPSSDVFAYLADGERCPEWRSGVVSIRRVVGDGGVGTQYAQQVRGPLGRKIGADYEITVSDPPRRLEFQTVSGPARPHGTYELEPTADGGTRLRFTLDVELGAVRGFLLGRAVQRTMDQEIRTIETLRDRLEAGSRSFSAPAGR
jgi:uncharacterized protein YndB with AHSA1/START domain